MNSMKNIHTVARYEARLLRRSWLFRIFAGLAVVGIFLAVGNWCTPLFGDGMTRWNRHDAVEPGGVERADSVL